MIIFKFNKQTQLLKIFIFLVKNINVIVYNIYFIFDFLNYFKYF